jgi:cell division GTPase FtsZ
MESFGKPSVKVIGVGEPGSEALSRLRGCGWDGVDFLKLAEEDKVDLQEVFRDTDMTIILADIQNLKDAAVALAAAECAKGMDVLTVVMTSAGDVPKALADAADTVTILPSDEEGSEAGTADSFAAGVHMILDMLSERSLVSMSFDDFRNCLSNVGVTAMASGQATGKDVIMEAVKKAAALLGENANLSKAKTMLMHVIGSGDNIGVFDIGSAGAFLSWQVHPDADILWAVTEDKSMGDNVVVTLLGSRFAI